MDFIDMAKAYWFQAFMGLIAAGFGVAYKRVVARLMVDKKDYESIKGGVVALLSDRIVQAYRYHMEQGYCSILDKQSMEKVFVSYQRLGGNGTTEKLYESITELPTKKGGN
ncbi:hypothetical protein FACS1894196_4500 [Clostridia bacterium]|nr:hypothetical protein FACS1894196_4500 [Clostridia bacterium]